MDPPGDETHTPTQMPPVTETPDIPDETIKETEIPDIPDTPLDGTLEPHDGENETGKNSKLIKWVEGKLPGNTYLFIYIILPVAMLIWLYFFLRRCYPLIWYRRKKEEAKQKAQNNHKKGGD